MFPTITTSLNASKKSTFHGESNGTLDGDDVGSKLGYLIGKFEGESEGTMDGEDMGRELGYMVYLGGFSRRI